MEKSTIITVALMFLVLVSLVQAVQIVGLKSKITGGVVSNSKESGGETYDEMMARMHPDQYAKQASPSTGSSPRMVGGC